MQRNTARKGIQNTPPVRILAAYLNGKMEFIAHPPRAFRLRDTVETYRCTGWAEDARQVTWVVGVSDNGRVFARASDVVWCGAEQLTMEM